MACSNSQELLELQKNNLIQSVRESFAVESKRLERLEKAATKEEKRLLERRFDEERQKDQQRIELLKQDFEIIQAKTTSGELQFQDKRSRLPSSPSKVKISLERFSGLDTEVDIVSTSGYSFITIIINMKLCVQCCFKFDFYWLFLEISHVPVQSLGKD